MDQQNISVSQPEDSTLKWKPDMTCRKDYNSWEQGEDNMWHGYYLDRPLVLSFNPKTYHEKFDALRAYFMDFNERIHWNELLERGDGIDVYYGCEDTLSSTKRIALYAVDPSNMEIIGSATICPKGPFRFEEIYVSDTRRRQGIGTKMMEVGDKYFGWSMVHVLTDNEPAIKFYQKMGFKIIGIETRPNVTTGEPEIPEDDGQKMFIMWK